MSNVIHHYHLLQLKFLNIEEIELALIISATLIDNKIYLYKMLTTNLLQAMLVKRVKQSHQHQQSSNSALLMH